MRSSFAFAFGLIAMFTARTLRGDTTDVLQNLCGLYYNVTEEAVTKFSNFTCTLLFRIANETADKVPLLCESLLHAADTECQLPQVTLFDIIRDISTNFVQRSSTFFVGLVRQNCERQWYWLNYDGSLSPAMTLLYSTDCSLTNAAYKDGSLIAVNPQTFSTNSIMCQCRLKQKADATTSTTQLPTTLPLQPSNDTSTSPPAIETTNRPTEVPSTSAASLGTTLPAIVASNQTAVTASSVSQNLDKSTEQTQEMLDQYSTSLETDFGTSSNPADQPSSYDYWPTSTAMITDDSSMATSDASMFTETYFSSSSSWEDSEGNTAITDATDDWMSSDQTSTETPTPTVIEWSSQYPDDSSSYELPSPTTIADDSSAVTFDASSSSSSWEESGASMPMTGGAEEWTSSDKTPGEEPAPPATDWSSQYSDATVPPSDGSNQMFSTDDFSYEIDYGTSPNPADQSSSASSASELPSSTVVPDAISIVTSDASAFTEDPSSSSPWEESNPSMTVTDVSENWTPSDGTSTEAPTPTTLDWSSQDPDATDVTESPTDESNQTSSTDFYSYDDGDPTSTDDPADDPSGPSTTPSTSGASSCQRVAFQDFCGLTGFRSLLALSISSIAALGFI